MVGGITLNPETTPMNEPSFNEFRIEDLQRRLKAAEDGLRRCERLAAAGRFAGAIMHEVNNPLEALSNIIYLTKALPTASVEVTSFLELAETQLRLIGKITRQTLRFYRSQAGPTDHDVAEIVESALVIHAMRIQKQGVEIRKQIDSPAMSKVVAGEILQIVSNLILNALDAAPHHEAILCVRVRTQSDQVMVTVADNGCGIDSSILKTLFQPNQTSKPEGTGFGLWLSHDIAAKHGGHIRVKTSVTPGRSGTAFCLALPRSAARLIEQA
jgi:C4-dicarboxylate-specific signal transduction histidine kinase